MLHNDISLLKSSIVNRVAEALEEMRSDDGLKKLGVDGIAVSETVRALPVQMAYYSRGRMGIQDVKAMYEAAGLWKISSVEATKMVTWTLKSKHLDGLAVDLVPMLHNAVWWAAPEKVWTRMGEIGEKHGLEWGGRWKNKDSPHFQEAD